MNGNWIKQFGISEADLAHLGIESPRTNPESLRFCLMNGKISEAEYLEWAMRSFELPAVSGDFFTAPTDPVFWARAKSLYPWSASFFPLAEWQGLYLIACLEPPTDFKFPHPHRFVLASARHLLLLWEHLNPQITSKAPIAMPKGQSSSVDTFNMPDGIIVNNALPTPQENTDSSPTLPRFDARFDAPMGLDHEATVVAPRPKTPDGLSATQDHEIPPLRTEPDGLVDVNNDAPTYSDIIETPAPSAPAPPITTSAPTAPPKATPKTTPAVQEENIQVKEEGKVEVTATNFTLTSSGVRPLASAHSLNSLGALALVHVMEHFEAAMILTIDNASGTLKPWKWSDALTSPKNAELTGIDLNLPSAFRVVFRSQQPYHGQMAASAVNSAYANAFTGGKLPIMTIVPVIENKNWYGMVVGMTTQLRNYKQVLGPMSDIGDELAKQLRRLSKTNAA